MESEAEVLRRCSGSASGDRMSETSVMARGRRFLLPAALVAVLVAAYWAWSWRPGVPSHHNFDRVREGMSLQEVEELLGPGDEVRGPGWRWSPTGGEPIVRGDRFFLWCPSDGFITVGMKDGRVVDADYTVLSL